MGKRRYIPRWISSEVAVNMGAGQVTLDPEVFMNKTAWPFKIEHLTIMGYAASALGVGDAWGGVSPIYTGEIGISGSTDINLVPAVLGASFFRKEPYVQLGEYLNGTTFNFKHPFILSRDSGFSCEVKMDTSLSFLNLPNDNPIRHGVALHGHRVQSNEPVMFAALYRHAIIEDGGSVTIDAADLLNNGEEDVLIDRIQFTHPYTDTDAILTTLSWKINPLSGLPWMENFIPISGLTPYVQFLQNPPASSLGMLPYSLTPLDGTYLYRKQRIGIKITPLVSDTVLQVTLFGYLEVE
jgi:hypothetical protein